MTSFDGRDAELDMLRSLLDVPPGAPSQPELIPALDTLLRICGDLGDTVAESWLCVRLAFGAMGQGNSVRAATWTAHSLRLAQRNGALSSGGLGIIALATIAAHRGDGVMVARLHGSVAQPLLALAVGLSPGQAQAYRDTIRATRERLGVGVFDAMAAEAALQPWNVALTLALAYAESLSMADPTVTGQGGATGGPIAGPSDGARPLTPRELDVLRLLARGDTNKEIGQALGLRPKTVMHHSVSIYGKLGLRGRADATAWAYRHGLAGEATRA